jgi:hypothetical protein
MQDKNQGTTPLEVVYNIQQTAPPPLPPQRDLNAENLEAQSAMIHAQATLNIANSKVADAQTVLQKLQPYMNIMAEIRVALNFPMVADNQMGMEKVALEKMWDELDIKRLRARYFSAMDKYFEEANIKLPQ